MTTYAVYCDSHDGVSQDGTVSRWDNYSDAEAAAGELRAMDPENSYIVIPEDNG